MKRSMLFGLAILASLSANAATISGAGSLPGAQALTIPALNYVGTGPVHFGNATWTSNDPESLFGSTVPFDYDSGPAGSPGEPIMRINQDQLPGYVTMTVTFDNPVKGVLAKIYWNNSAASPFGYNSGNSAYFAAYDSGGNVLYNSSCPPGSAANCSWQLDDNGANPDRHGQYYPVGPGYYGYSFTGPVIKSINFSNRYMGVTQLFYAPGVPEPASWAMLIVGFGIAGAAMRRSRTGARSAASR